MCPVTRGAPLFFLERLSNTWRCLDLSGDCVQMQHVSTGNVSTVLTIVTVLRHRPDIGSSSDKASLSTGSNIYQASCSWGLSSKRKTPKIAPNKWRNMNPRESEVNRALLVHSEPVNEKTFATIHIQRAKPVFDFLWRQLQITVSPVLQKSKAEPRRISPAEKSSKLWIPATRHCGSRCDGSNSLWCSGLLTRLPSLSVPRLPFSIVSLTHNATMIVLDFVL